VVLFVHGLPAPPPGKTYQLWLIAAGAPIGAGVFGVDESGSARHTAVAPVPLDAAVTVAVTLEPAGGVEQPTGPVVLSAI
jgi:anti-sigma-K factor RskA